MRSNFFFGRKNLEQDWNEVQNRLMAIENANLINSQTAKTQRRNILEKNELVVTEKKCSN